jgi:hypothetical protein
LFYNDYQYYPEDNGSGAILGCGTSDAPETVACSGSLITSGTDGVVYMQSLPASFNYTQTSGGDAYILYTLLENVSDTNIEESAAKCGISSPVASAFYACE